MKRKNKKISLTLSALAVISLPITTVSCASYCKGIAKLYKDRLFPAPPKPPSIGGTISPPGVQPGKENNLTSEINSFADVYTDAKQFQTSKYFQDHNRFYTYFVDAEKVGNEFQLGDDISLREGFSGYYSVLKEINFDYAFDVWWRQGTKKYYDYIFQIHKINSSIFFESMVKKLTEDRIQPVKWTLEELYKMGSSWNQYSVETMNNLVKKITENTVRGGDYVLPTYTYNLDFIRNAYGDFYEGKGNSKTYNNWLPDDKEPSKEAIKLTKPIDMSTETNYEHYFQTGKNWAENIKDRHFTFSRKNETGILELSKKMKWRSADTSEFDRYFNIAYPFSNSSGVTSNTIGPKIGSDMKQWEPSYFYDMWFYPTFIPYHNSKIQSYQIDFLSKWIKFIHSLKVNLRNENRSLIENLKNTKGSLNELIDSTNKLLDPLIYWNHTDKDGKDWLFMDEERKEDMSPDWPSNQRQYYKMAMFINNNVLVPFSWLLNAGSTFKKQLIGNDFSKAIYDGYYKQHFGEPEELKGNSQEIKNKSARIKIKNFLLKYLNCTDNYKEFESDLLSHVLCYDFKNGSTWNDWIDGKDIENPNPPAEPSPEE